jgi:hypothetical protein
VTELDNRFSTMTEVRRVGWPRYEIATPLIAGPLSRVGLSISGVSLMSF